MGFANARAETRERAARRSGGRPPAACLPGFDVAANAATLRTLMAGADAGTRHRLADAVQRRHGNAALQRLVAPDAALRVQRWAVTLPVATTDCDTIVAHMNTKSPYRANGGWAGTRPSFSWGGDPSYSEANGVITATVTNPTVKKTVSVDMPSWSPTNPTVAAGWSAMIRDLRAHEARHEGIATTWETTLRSRLAALSVTVPDRTPAAFTAAVQARWDGWIAQHQAAQVAIDPYSAVLACGDADETESTGLDGDVAAGAGD